MLTAARTYALCDLYIAFVRVLVACVASSDAPIDRRNLLSLVDRAAQSLPDPHLSILTSMLKSITIPDRDDLQDELFDLASMYTSGEYEYVISRTSKLLPRYPTCIELYELNARSCVNAQVEMRQPFADRAIGNEILSFFIDALNRNGEAAAALERLLKLAYVLDCTPAGFRILSFCLQQLGQQHHLGTRAFLAMSSTRITPWACSGFNTRQTAVSFINACNAAYPDNASVTLFRYYITPQENIEPAQLDFLPEYRRIKYQAMRAELNGNFHEAADLYRKLFECAEGRGTVLHSAVCGQLRSLYRSNQPREAADLIVDIYIARRDIAIGEATNHTDLIAKALAKLSVGPSSERNATTALALYIAFTVHPEDYNDYLLYVAYEECLAAHQVARPTEMLKASTTMPRSRLLAFLRYVCIPPVMRRSYHISGTDALENERLRILQYLLSNEPERKSETESEIADLTKRAALRAALTQVESSRIYVNLDGIRRSLQSEHAQKFQRYIRMLGLSDEGLRRQLRKYDFERKTVFYSDVAVQLFEQLFIDIRDRFVSSKADGLDTYLSMRIRHGHLSAQLRGQFEQLHLVTRYLESDGVYARNDYWSNQFRNLGPEIVESVDRVLRTLSEQVDKIIDDINSHWIRIRTNGDNCGAMFNYSYSIDDLAKLYIQLSGVFEHDEFVERCFQALWSRTEQVLQSVRARLTEETRPALAEALTMAEHALNDIDPAIRSSELQSKVTTCRTNIQIAVNRVTEWFTTSSLNVIEAFDFALLLETATQIVRRVHPEVSFDPQCTLDDTLRLDGKWFNACVDVMYILLDNAVRHSRTPNVNCDVAISSADNKLTVSVSNALGQSVDTVAAREKARALVTSFEGDTAGSKLQTEGGTGFVKLHKLLWQDLRLPKPRIHCEVGENGPFKIELTMPANHLRASS